MNLIPIVVQSILLLFFSSPVFCIEVSTKLAMKVKAVIFDLDGTLIDTESLSTLAIEQVLKTIGYIKPISWYEPRMKYRSLIFKPLCQNSTIHD